MADSTTGILGCQALSSHMRFFLDNGKLTLYNRTMKSKKYITNKTARELLERFGTQAAIADNLKLSYRQWCYIKSRQSPLSPRVELIIKMALDGQKGA